MLEYVVVDGREFRVGDARAERIVELLVVASDGDVLVAATSREDVVVRRVSAEDAERLIIEASERPRAFEIDYDGGDDVLALAETEFDHVAAERAEDLLELYGEFNASAREPESYRRWLSRLRRRWTRRSREIATSQDGGTVTT